MTINANMSKMTVAERKEKFGRSGETNGMFGRTHSAESIEKIKSNRKTWANPHKGKSLNEIMSAESVERIKMAVSSANTGNEYWLGKTHTDETKEKIRNAKLGKTHTSEAKLNMSAAQKLRWSNMPKVPIYVNGIKYDSIGKASELLGVSRKTLRNRSKNPKFDVVLGTI